MNVSFLNKEFDVTPPTETVSIPTIPGQVIQADVGSVLNWVITGKVLPYDNNRGNGAFANVTVKSIEKKGVIPDIIGECTIGMFARGNEKPHMRFNNFHSRAAGLLSRLSAGNLTAQEISTPVSVRVQQDFLSSYQGMNAAGSAHRTKDKIRNPDLAYGAIIAEIENNLPDDFKSVLGENKYTPVISLIYSLVNQKKSWYWPDVYQTRGTASKKADEKAGTLKLSKTKKEALVESIEYWYELVKLLSDHSERFGDVKKVIRSAGFFGYVVTDRLSKKFGNSGRHLPDSVKIANNRILKHLNDVVQSCPSLSRADAEEVLRICISIDKRLKS